MKLAMKMFNERFIFKSCVSGHSNAWAASPIISVIGKDDQMRPFHVIGFQVYASGKINNEYRVNYR